MMETATRQLNEDSHILIVEDDCSIASLIADVIEGEIGATTTMLHNGAEAIRFLSCQEVDLVVLDYQLPGASGMQVCEAMQCLPRIRATPVLFVTANAEGSDFQSRGLPYMRKPFDLAEFLDTVEHCLHQRQPDNASVAS